MDQFTDRRIPDPIDAPIIDEVIEQASDDRETMKAQLEALRTDIDQIRESVSHIVKGSRQVVAAKINEQPLGSVLLVAAAAYLLGRMR